MTIETTSDIILHPIGDTHIGHTNSNVKKLINELNHIVSTPEHRIILMGDLIDCGIKSAIGASAYEQILTPNEQLNTIVDIFSPIRSQIDGVLMGNHEYRIYKESGVDIIEQFCNILSVPYLMYSGVVTYSMRSSNGTGRAYNINAIHGSGGGTVESSLRKCKAMAQKVTADAYLMGHCHQKAHTKRLMEYVDSRNGKLIEQEQHFILTGHMLEYNDSYADQANLEISPPEFPVITLNGLGKEKKITVV